MKSVVSVLNVAKIPWQLIVNWMYSSVEHIYLSVIITTRRGKRQSLAKGGSIVQRCNLVTKAQDRAAAAIILVHVENCHCTIYSNRADF